MNLFYSAIFTAGTKLTVERTKAIGNALGLTLWHVLRKRRKLAISSIKKHLNIPHAEAERIAKSSFKHNCRSFLELFLVPSFDSNLLNKYIIEDPSGGLEKAAQSDYPIVGIGAHIGAWEILSAVLGERGRASHRAQPLIVVRTNKNKKINELIFKLRGGRDTKVLGHRNTAFSVLRSLKKKGIACFLVDHNTKRKEALFTKFLGETAAVNSGPAFLALRGKAVVVPVFLIRNKEGSYTLIVEPFLQTEELTGTREEKIQQITLFYTQSVERMIKKYPEQWFWMHNRWKTKPTAEDFVLK